MTPSQETRRKVAKLDKELRDLLNAVAESGKPMTDDQSNRSAEIRLEIEKLEALAENQEFTEKRDTQQAKAESDAGKVATMASGQPADQGEAREKRKMLHEFRLSRALKAQYNNRQYDGVERELHKEAIKESRQFGGSIEGFGIPAWAIYGEKRDQTAGNAASAGNTIATEMRDFIPALRPTPMVQTMGAVDMDGLQGNIDIPKANDTAQAQWEGENEEAQETNPTFEKLPGRPHRLSAVINVSRQLMLQSVIPPSVEAYMRDDLRIAQELALDAAAINGSGTGNVPEGLLTNSDVNQVELGTNGAVLDRTSLIKLIKEPAVKNAVMANMGFLSNPDVMAKLMATKTDAGSGIFVLPDATSNLLGYRAGFSTQVPNNLTKGTGTELSAVIFGNFRQLMMMRWGGIDLLVDPYTRGTEALVRIILNSYHDILNRQPKAFAVIKDAITTL
ncbi:MAG: phage major capsid protein [Bacteroidota bacterium]